MSTVISQRTSFNTHEEARVHHSIMLPLPRGDGRWKMDNVAGKK